MNNKICLITGASSGIGKITAIELAKKGIEVLVVCRNMDQAKSLVANIKKQSDNQFVDFFIADLNNLATVKQLTEDFKSRYSRLDILINNAGVFYQTRKETADGLEAHWGVNYMSHFLLTNLLLENLKNSDSARVINVSSSAHKWAKIDFNNLDLKRNFIGLRAYGNSKLAQLYFTYELARKLKDTKISVNALHPGFVSTGIGRTDSISDFFFTKIGKLFMLTPDQGAETSIYLASSPEVEGITGKFFIKSKAVKSSFASYNVNIAKKLYALSEQYLIDLKFLDANFRI